MIKRGSLPAFGRQIALSDNHHHHTYHVTFEVESGDWMELKIGRSEYSMGGLIMGGIVVLCGMLVGFAVWCG